MARRARLSHVPCLAAALLFAASLNTGCSASMKGLPAGSIFGRAQLYDYSPSAIESKKQIQVWWCGQAFNPNDPHQQSDTIQYATVDVSTGAASHPQTVLAETPGAWDSAYTCNPQVVGGAFVNPLGDGHTYSYAMYYVGTDKPSGFGNSIGVAFSNDGVHWNKYPHPVIRTGTETHYGIGQPVPYNADGKAGIELFYEDSNALSGAVHREAVSSDGLHFTPAGTLTTIGLADPEASWGDMAFDPGTGDWYAAFNLPLRAGSTTGADQERGQGGVRLYRIPKEALLTGTTPWQPLHTFDTNATGSEANFIAGFVRDPDGNLSAASYPTVQLLTSISNPSPAWNATPAQMSRSANPDDWDLGMQDWRPGQPLLTLDRYKNATAYDVTTGYVDPSGGFVLDQSLGKLYEAPHGDATQALYACKSGDQGYFVSKDGGCEGKYRVGLEGYAYAQPQPGVKTRPLYRCQSPLGSFLSNDPKCEGKGKGALLGYALP